MSITEEEHEIHNIEDIWIERIFPILTKEISAFRLPLFIVSRKWLQMMSRSIKELTFPSKLRLISEPPSRIVSLVESLTTHTDMVPYLILFPKLRVLTLTCQRDYSPYWRLPYLPSLTTLTIGKYARVCGLDKEPNLVHLSIMYMTEENAYTFKSCVKLQTLKKLHLGRNCDEQCSRVQLLDFVPENHNLEYLECDDLSVFQTISYTGQGRVEYGLQKGFSYYEGEWVNGKEVL